MCKILLLGSYAGQDSLGDKGLLLSVTAQLNRAMDGRCDFVSHVAQFEDGFAPEHITFKRGVWSVTAACLGMTKALASVPMLQYIAALCLLPIWWAYKPRNRRVWKAFSEDCSQCDALYFYGGTQLSATWFELNFPSLLLTVIQFRVRGKPVFFGPQQYGPLTPRQARWLRWTIRWFVNDYRTRNTECLRLLQADDSKLTFDEIFSCDTNYEVSTPSKRGKYLVANFRGINFSGEYESIELRKYCEIIKEVSLHYSAPVKVIQMSGPTFCDDTGVRHKLESMGINVEILPHTHNEREIIEIAKESIGSISMSFHGCILTMLAGRPAVPVTSGYYYDHKYIDFDRYTGNQGVPLVSLRESDSIADSRRIVNYFDTFCPRRLISQRDVAVEKIRRWYGEIASAIRKE